MGKIKAHFRRCRKFTNVKDIRIGVQEFIDSKPKEWYRQGLHDLAKRWVQIIENGGLYFDY